MLIASDLDANGNELLIEAVPACNHVLAGVLEKSI